MACIQSSFIGSTYLHLDEIYINIYENNLYGAHKALKLKIKEFIKENEECTVCDKSDKSHIRGMKLFNKILKRVPYNNMVDFHDSWTYEVRPLGLFYEIESNNIEDIEIILDREIEMFKAYSSHFNQVIEVDLGDTDNVDSNLLSIPDIIAYNFRLLNEILNETSLTYSFFMSKRLKNMIKIFLS